MRECCKFSVSTSKFGCMSYIVVSSACESVVYRFSDRINGKSLMKIKNSNGFNTDPCRTPQVTSDALNVLPFIDTF